MDSVYLLVVAWSVPVVFPGLADVLSYISRSLLLPVVQVVRESVIRLFKSRCIYFLKVPSLEVR
jgi:hypothetical protein